MRVNNHQISNRGGKNVKDPFFPNGVVSEIHILISRLKEAFLYTENNYQLQENEKEESTIISKKSNNDQDASKKDGISNPKIVHYVYANSNEIDRLMHDFKYKTYSSINLQDLRNGNYILIDERRNKCIILNSYDIKRIKGKIILSINIESFWSIRNFNLKSFEKRASFDVVREIGLPKNIRANLNDEKKKLLRNYKTKLELINNQIDFYLYQLMNKKNEKNNLETDEDYKRIDELIDKVIYAFDEKIVGEMYEDNDLLTLKIDFKRFLSEKEYRRRKFTLGDKKDKCISKVIRRGGNAISENVSKPLFDEFEKNLEKDNLFKRKMDNFNDYALFFNESE